MSIGDPQSFNRYSYVQNDPVNFVDPSGLFWGRLFGWLKEGRPLDYGDSGGNRNPDSTSRILEGGEYFDPVASQNAGQQDNRTTCERMADDAQRIADEVAKSFRLAINALRDLAALQLFNRIFGVITFGTYFSTSPWGFAGTQGSGRQNVYGTRSYQGQDGFAPEFHDETAPEPNPDQVHHFGAYFSAGLAGHKLIPDIHRADDRDAGNMGDVRLADQSRALG